MILLIRKTVNKVFELEYKIILKSNFLTAQTSIIGKDMNASYKRDLEEKPIIYGRHIKGILREKFNNIGLDKIFQFNLKEVERNIFGSEGIYRPALIFSNLYLSNKDFKSNKRHSIRVDRETRITEENSLFNYEFIEINQEFLGQIKFEKNFKNDEIKALLISLFHIDKIGGYKSRGLGNVEIKIKLENDYVGIEKLDEIVNEILNSYSKNNYINKGELELEEFDFNLEFLSPIVLQENIMGNLITTRNDLQGSTLRGALIQLGLNKGFLIEDLLNIEVKLENKNLKLKSEFETKYKTKSGKKLKIDKSIIVNEDKLLLEEYGNKFQRKNNMDFEDKSDDISIKIYNDEKIETDLFNHQVIENVNNKLNNLYKGSIKIPKLLISNLEEILYIGKYKSKGFGKVKIKIKNKEKISYKEEIINRINEFNKNINDNKIYITFDLLSDLIVPISYVDNVLEYFKYMVKMDINPEANRSFLNVEKLYGYNIINNIRKGTELVISKGSVLTFSIKDLDDIIDKLVVIEKNSLGLRRKEGFGMIRICSYTEARKEVKDV